MCWTSWNNSKKDVFCFNLKKGTELRDLKQAIKNIPNDAILTSFIKDDLRYELTYILETSKQGWTTQRPLRGSPGFPTIGVYKNIMEKDNNIKLTIKRQYIIEFSNEIPIKELLKIINNFSYNVKLISCEKISEINFRSKYKLFFEKEETNSD